MKRRIAAVIHKILVTQVACDIALYTLYHIHPARDDAEYGRVCSCSTPLSEKSVVLLLWLCMTIDDRRVECPLLHTPLHVCPDNI